MVPRVLVLEDDNAIRKLLVAALRRESLEVDAGSDGAEGLLLVQERDYAVILLDLMMPRLNGLEFLAAFRRAAPSARSVIVVTTASDEFMLRSLPASEVHAVIRKPFDVSSLVAMIREVAFVYTTHETKASRTEVHTVGDDTAARARAIGDDTASRRKPPAS
jgi:DNA-binding response OmpR family regulator